MRKRHVPQRSCIICGTKAAKRELVRVVLTPEGACEVDETGKQPGRGAYLCHQPRCWERAAKTDRLAGALRGPISDDDKQALARYGAALAETAESAS
jgi:predicted RNA-binding protein YlxR (DUF448 family)